MKNAPASSSSCKNKRKSTSENTSVSNEKKIKTTKTLTDDPTKNHNNAMPNPVPSFSSPLASPRPDINLEAIPTPSPENNMMDEHLDEMLQSATMRGQHYYYPLSGGFDPEDEQQVAPSPQPDIIPSHHPPTSPIKQLVNSFSTMSPICTSSPKSSKHPSLDAALHSFLSPPQFDSSSKHEPRAVYSSKLCEPDNFEFLDSSFANSFHNKGVEAPMKEPVVENLSKHCFIWRKNTD